MQSKKNTVLRQNRINRFIHWGTALSISVLLISGLGQLPLYKRYNIVKLPGGEWLGSFFNTLDLHYLAAAFLIFVISFHLVYHGLRREFDFLPKRGDFLESYRIIKAMITGSKEPPAEKYLAEQRIAYFYIGSNIVILIITGIVKILKNFPGNFLPHTLISFSTHLHNLSTVLLVLGIAVHLGAFIFKANRPLLKGMFIGYVDAGYAKHRHPLWFEKISKKD